MTSARPAVLVADDDAVARDLLVEVLEREGYRVRAASGGSEAIALAEREVFDVALVDLRMPEPDGLAVLARLVALEPAPAVLILTAFAAMDTAIEAIRRGAYDYLSKPFRLDDIKRAVRRTLEVQRLARDNQRYRRELRERFDPDRLVGHSPEIVAIYKLVARVAGLDTTVLIQGETGTGKELVARAIHYAGSRSDRPFVVIDCAASPSRCSSRSCSVTSAAPSRARSPRGAGCSRRRRAAPASSTRSRRCRRRSRPSCCVRCKTACSGAWAATSRSPSMCGWWRPPTAI